MSAAKDEMYTVVENLCDTSRKFPYLGDQGMELAAHEVVAMRGDLRLKLAHQKTRRNFEALERSMARKSLQIRSTPSPIFFDEADGIPKTLAIDNGALGVVDPTWNSSDSENFAGV